VRPLLLPAAASQQEPATGTARVEDVEAFLQGQFMADVIGPELEVGRARLSAAEGAAWWGVLQ
jgi:hypothetical protein